MGKGRTNKVLKLTPAKRAKSWGGRLEKIIKFKYGRHIPHNAIHQVLLDKGLASENKKKKKRRKPWIRYERKHSLTAVHLDWHASGVNGKEVCIVLDGSSRLVLAGGEFSKATSAASIELVRKALNEVPIINFFYKRRNRSYVVSQWRFSPSLFLEGESTKSGALRRTLKS